MRRIKYLVADFKPHKTLGQTITDEHFGNLEVVKNKRSGIHTLSKTIDFGLTGSMVLYLENQSDQSTQDQFQFFNTIIDNSPEILEAANKVYFDCYQTDIYKDFVLESLSITDKDHNWELWLVRIGGIENCVIKFDGLTCKGISFQS